MSQAKAFQQSNNAEHMDSSQMVANRDFHGAAIIDEHGKEIPITEEMILQACNDLSSSWIFPRQTH